MIISHEDNLNGRQPYWKKTLLEDKLAGRQAHRKMTSQEDNLAGRQTHRKMSLAQLSPSLFCFFITYSFKNGKCFGVFCTEVLSIHGGIIFYFEIKISSKKIALKTSFWQKFWIIEPERV